MSLRDQKNAARKAAFIRRKAAFEAGGLDRDAQEQLRKALQPFHGKTLAAYMPIRTEISPLPVMEEWSGTVAVPVVQGNAQPLKFLTWQVGCKMIEGAFGAAIPEDGIEIEPEILIVPLVAFTRSGYRLGYGGGFYDRSLEKLSKRHPITAIGFAYSAQETHHLPLEPTDISLDHIVTETEIITPKPRN